MANPLLGLIALLAIIVVAVADFLVGLRQLRRHRRLAASIVFSLGIGVVCAIVVAIPLVPVDLASRLAALAGFAFCYPPIVLLVLSWRKTDGNTSQRAAGQAEMMDDVVRQVMWTMRQQALRDLANTVPQFMEAIRLAAVQGSRESAQPRSVFDTGAVRSAWVNLWAAAVQIGDPEIKSSAQMLSALILQTEKKDAVAVRAAIEAASPLAARIQERLAQLF